MVNLAFDLYRSNKRPRRTSNEQIGQSFLRMQGNGSLYPDYAGFARKDGSFRAPDVTTITDANKVQWVRGVNEIDEHTKKSFVSADEGVSLYKTPGKFGYDLWFYSLLPQGTPVPDAFDVVQTGRDPNHYSIRCKNMLRRDVYEGYLNNLARAAIAKSVELGRKSLYFS